MSGLLYNSHPDPAVSGLGATGGSIAETYKHEYQYKLVQNIENYLLVKIPIDVVSGHQMVAKAAGLGGAGLGALLGQLSGRRANGRRLGMRCRRLRNRLRKPTTVF